jgi:hypothetical protein
LLTLESAVLSGARCNMLSVGSGGGKLVNLTFGKL